MKFSYIVFTLIVAAMLAMTGCTTTTTNGVTTTTLNPQAAVALAQSSDLAANTVLADLVAAGKIKPATATKYEQDGATALAAVTAVLNSINTTQPVAENALNAALAASNAYLSEVVASKGGTFTPIQLPTTTPSVQ